MAAYLKRTNWKHGSRDVSLKSVPDKENWKYVNKWRCVVPYKWVLFLVLLTLCFAQTMCQDCDFPPTVFNILETDPAGTEIFNASSYNRTNVYSYTTNLGWLSTFLNLTLNETDLFYYMRLTQPLDLEDIYYNLSVTDISAFPFTLYCRTQTQRSQECHIIVEAVNESPPQFNTSSIQLSVKETLLKSSVVINLTSWASDQDVNQISREIAGYSFLPYTGDPQVDGHMWLQMLIAYDGIVVLKKDLDYETLPAAHKFILLGVKVTDQGGKSGTASLTLFVVDDDDLPPMFTYPGCRSPCHVTYTATVSSNVNGPVTDIKPAPINALDGDTLNYQIEYHIVQDVNIALGQPNKGETGYKMAPFTLAECCKCSVRVRNQLDMGPASYEQYININNTTGNITILYELRASGLRTLVLIVEAREISSQARSTRTTLLITVDDGTKEEAMTSASSKDDTTIIAVATVLTMFIVIVVVLLVIMMIYFKKRYKKTVHPESSVTTLQGLNVLDRMDDQTPDSMKVHEKMIVSRNDSQITLDSNGHGHMHIITPRATPREKTTQALNGKENKQPASFDNHEFLEKQTIGHVADDKDEVMEYLVTTSDKVSDMSATLSLNESTEKIEMNSSDQNDERLTALSGPKLTILSGLKIADESNDTDDHYATVGSQDEASTSKSDLSDAGHLTVSSTWSSSPNTETELSSKPVPLRKKRPRKRAKTAQGLGENVYDGTVNIESVELDSGFYTDTTKTRIRRSSRLPAVVTDPNDTRYWITINDNE